MSGFLLGTSVLAELIKPRPNVNVSGWIDATDEGLLYLSAITLGEFRCGVAMSSQTRQRTRREAWLMNELRDRFQGRMLDVDGAVADRWGLISAQAQKQGIVIPVIDGLLAATALHHNLTFVTDGPEHLATFGLSIFDPWANRFHLINRGLQ
jgi:predicted nucleic acid-binding protein